MCGLHVCLCVRAVCVLHVGRRNKSQPVVARSKCPHVSFIPRRPIARSALKIHPRRRGDEGEGRTRRGKTERPKVTRKTANEDTRVRAATSFVRHLAMPSMVGGEDGVYGGQRGTTPRSTYIPHLHTRRSAFVATTLSRGCESSLPASPCDTACKYSRLARNELE